MTLRPRPATLVLLAALLGIALAWRGGHGGVPAPAEDLARLVPGHRPLLGRTTLETPHAPFDPAAPRVGPAEREQLYARLLAAKVGAVPGGAAALAAFYVARAEAGDAARALRDAPDPVDRGAVLLALDRPDEALDELAKALATRPADPAARFDRALALEALRLDGQAAEAWDAFLAVEASGGWADEARARLAALREAPTPAAKPLDLQKREAIEGLLAAAGPDDLGALRPVAARLAEAGDELVDRELRYLEALDGAGWKRRQEEVRRFVAARETVFAGRDAGEELGRLERSPDPLLAVKAVHLSAYAAILRGDRVVGGAALGRLERLCRRYGCREELALVASDLGTLQSHAGDHREAERSFARGLELLPVGFAGRRAEILSKQAAMVSATGAPKEAARLLGEVLAIERSLRLDHALSSTLTTRSLAFRAQGRMAADEASLRESIAAARADGLAFDHVRATQSLVHLLVETGRRPAGISLLEQLIASLRGAALERQLADCLDDLARLRLQEGNGPDALAAAREAVALARSHGTEDGTAAALEALARAAEATGDPELALRSIDEAVGLDTHRIARTPNGLPARRLATRLAGRRLLLARLLAERGATARALEVFLGGPPGAAGPGECRLGVALADDRLLSFAWSAEGVRFEARLLGLAEAALLERPYTPDVDPVIGSVWARARCPAGASRLTVHEPPGALLQPLAALAARERPDAAVGVALAPDARWPGPRRRGTAVAVYSATTPGEGASALPDGRFEAGTIERWWGPVERLSGPEATLEHLAEHAPDADLIHLAVHAIAGGPEAASYLLLAGREGRVQVGDVLGLDLGARSPLVVLSGCRTAPTSRNLEADGAGLPWAFLSAGAGAVVGHQGDVLDRDALTFSRAFYEALSTGLPPAEAVAAGNRHLPPDSGGSFVLYFQ